MRENNQSKTWYLCDGKVPDCKKTHCYYKKVEDGCKHTSDINHAVNFEKTRGGYYREKENGKTLQEEWTERRSATSEETNMTERELIDLP